MMSGPNSKGAIATLDDRIGNEAAIEEASAIAYLNFNISCLLICKFGLASPLRIVLFSARVKLWAWMMIQPLSIMRQP